jgi:hypothetical protein
VVLDGHLAIGLFDFVGRGGLLDAEDVVELHS